MNEQFDTTNNTLTGETQESQPDVIPLTLGDRRYNAPRIIADDESVIGPPMLERAKAKNATSDKEDWEWFLSHQDELNAQIPVEHRGKVIFVFTESRDPVCSENVAVVCRCGDRWVQCWLWLDYGWGGHTRPVGRSV